MNNKFFFSLVKNHPHKFFLMLVIQAQEFVVELKIRIMRPLQDNNLARIAEIFLTSKFKIFVNLLIFYFICTEITSQVASNLLRKKQNFQAITRIKFYHGNFFLEIIDFKNKLIFVSRHLNCNFQCR